MRIGIQTWGSLGDILPLASLADGLRTAGHDVSLQVCAVEPDFDYSRLHTTVPVEPINAQGNLSRDEFSQVTKEFSAETNPLKQAQSIVETLLAPVDDDLMHAAERLCAAHDLVIGHFFAYPLRIAAEKTSTPYASVMLVHSAVPSAHYPPSGMPNLGPFVNRLAWKGVRAMLNKHLLASPNRLRSAHGLPPARDLIDDVWASERLNLIAVSSALCPQQDDWDPRHHVCGFLTHTDAHFDTALDEDLNAFLDAGPAPVFVTFGSVSPASSEAVRALLSLLDEVRRNTGCRLIVQLPTLPDTPQDASKDVFIVGAVNHAALFPKCAAVIHHGGAGTTHTALRAGVPSVVVAHIDEQLFWGRELQRLGLAAKPLARRNLTAQGLSKALAHVLRTPTIRQAAQALAPTVRLEDGVATAITLLSQNAV